MKWPIDGKGWVSLDGPQMPVIELEMCQLKNTGKKLTFDGLMPDTDKLKKNKKRKRQQFRCIPHDVLLTR